MALKEDMAFELRFFKKYFDEILKNNSDYRTKIYRKNGVPILSIIETLDEEPEIEIYISYTKNKYNADDYIVNVNFPFSYNKKEIKISYAEIENIPDFCKELAKDNLKIDKIDESIQLLKNAGYIVERQYPEGIKLITIENLKNLKDGETIETPRGTFEIERFYDQINLYENGKLVSRDYLSEYLSYDGYDKAWERLYDHLAKWLNLELCY